MNARESRKGNFVFKRVRFVMFAKQFYKLIVLPVCNEKRLIIISDPPDKGKLLFHIT